MMLFWSVVAAVMIAAIIATRTKYAVYLNSRSQQRPKALHRILVFEGALLGLTIGALIAFSNLMMHVIG